MPSSQPDLKTYRANCHCGAYVLEVKLPEIRIIYQCDCNLCTKKALLYQSLNPENIIWVKGDPSTLTSYTVGEQTGHKKLTPPLPTEEKFCPNCGSALVAGFGETKNHVTHVNVS
jgi:hypothetical protein